MEDNHIWNRISRKISKESTQEDEVLFNGWVNSDKRHFRVYKMLTEIWNYHPVQTHDSSAIYKQYKQRLENYNHFNSTKRGISYWYRIAAVLVLVVGLSFFFGYYFNNKQKISLVYQEVSVPKGSRTAILLPDSSKVWISNNSIIKFPSQFSRDSRELFLSGEAYFEVTHDKEKPFIVNIGENRIKVLGTKFSVNAYPEDDQVIASLIEGEILFQVRNDESDEYKSVELRAGHGIVYDKKEQKLSDHLIEHDFHSYWDRGVYTFKNESFESLSKKIFRIYNVKIIFLDEYLKSKTYSGSFSMDDNIFTFMEFIKSTSVEPIAYSYRDNEISVRLK